MAEVVIAEAARQQLLRCWSGQGQGAALRQKLFPDADAWLSLVCQTLSRDIRSVHQRLHQPQGPASGAMQQARAALSGEGCDGELQTVSRGLEDAGQYRLVLQGICILYDVEAAGCVMVKAAQLVQDESSDE